MSKPPLEYTSDLNPKREDVEEILVDIGGRPAFVYDVFIYKAASRRDPENIPIGTKLMTPDEVQNKFTLRERENLPCSGT
jgi:hypothetical protein